jgi:WD40 repeat protein
VESAEKLLAGGRHGRAVVPGKSAESTLVKYLTGALKPQMPPAGPLPLDQVALIKRWIDEGAKIDSMTAPVERGGVMRGAMPMVGAPVLRSGHATGLALLPLAVTQAAPVTALAYSPDGKLLAAGGYRAVRILNPEDGALLHALPGPSDQVLSVAWSSDGKRLAAAGGVSGTSGEVCVWDVPASGAWPKPRELRGHADTVYAVAWRPNAAEVLTASLDKTARIWDAGTGATVKVLKDHVDSVLGGAYSPDGKWLATGSLDRTVKLYDAATREKVASYTNPEGVTAIGFGAKSDILVACAEKQVRVWPVKPGTVENPLRGHGEGEAVTSLAFSADGATFAWGAANRKVRIWNGEVSSHRREMGDAMDWVYAVALTPDGKTVAAGVGDGKVYFWTTADGKLQRSVVMGAAK